MNCGKECRKTIILSNSCSQLSAKNHTRGTEKFATSGSWILCFRCAWHACMMLDMDY